MVVCFMTLKCFRDNNIRYLTILHALSPLIHKKLFDLFAPEEPTRRPYEELVAICYKLI